MLFSRSIALILIAQLLYTALPALANPTSTQFCRSVRQGETARRWTMEIVSGSLGNSLPGITQELEAVRKKGNIELTANSLDILSTLIASQAKTVSPAQYASFNVVLDQMAELSRSLPSGFNLVKVKALTEVGLAYQRPMRIAKSREVLQLAIPSVHQIQDIRTKLAAQLRLAEGMIAYQDPATESILKNAFSNGLKIQDIYTRNQSLEQLIKLNLQANQPARALEVMQKLPKETDRTTFTLQIAAAYAKRNDPTSAQKLLNPLIQQALISKEVDQREMKLMDIIIHYSPSGDLKRSLSLISQMKRPTALRARAWLVIAGEARNFNQLEMRKQAIVNLVKDATAAKMKDEFAGRFDHEWYGEMSSLIESRQYQPEFKDFIAEFKPTNFLRQVIRDFIQQKQFDAARKIVPRPLIVQIDAGAFDITDEILDEIALAELQELKPNAAIDRVSNQNIDIFRLLKFAQAFHQAGDRAFTDKLFDRAKAQVSQGSELQNQALLANALVLTDRPAKLVIDRMIKLIQAEKEPAKQAELLLSIRESFRETRSTYFDLAEQLNVMQQVDFATTEGFQALQASQADVAYRFVGSAGKTNSEKFNFVLGLADLHLKQGQPIAARSILDMPIRTLLDGPESSKPPSDQQSYYFTQIAEKLARSGSPKEALSIAQSVTPTQDREALKRKIRCY